MREDTQEELYDQHQQNSSISSFYPEPNQIQPNNTIEVFILDAAAELNVNLADYGLPTELNELRKITKTITAKEDVTFARLFQALRTASHIQCLDNVLQYLLTNKYNASDTEIRKIMQIPS